MKFDPTIMLVARCVYCEQLLIVPKDSEPLNPSIASMGYKRTGCYLHAGCRVARDELELPPPRYRRHF